MDSLNQDSLEDRVGSKDPIRGPVTLGSYSARPGKRRGRLGLRLLTVGGIAYIGILVLLLLNETFLVYPGSKYPRGNWTPANFTFEEIEFDSLDGTQLVGWYLPHENPQCNILVCHGNAENVAQSSAYVGKHLREHLQANVFVYDYRGYGKSAGKPNEPGVLQDSEAALRWLNQRTETDPRDVILVGHSLGGGPAVHLASRFGAKALVLQRTFSSLVGAAQEIYWWLPVRYMMQNQYRSDEKILDCHDIPLFQSHGAQDRVISVESARELFERCPCPHKQFYEVAGMNHYDRLPEAYWIELKKFVESIE